MDPQPLAGRTIAVPETRELEVFAAMLERRGASVVRCPLVAIRDAPDPAPVLALDRKSTRLNSSHLVISYAVFCLKKKTSTTRPLSPAYLQRRVQTQRKALILKPRR